VKRDKGNSEVRRSGKSEQKKEQKEKEKDKDKDKEQKDKEKEKEQKEKDDPGGSLASPRTQYWTTPIIVKIQYNLKSGDFSARTTRIDPSTTVQQAVNDLLKRFTVEDPVDLTLYTTIGDKGVYLNLNDRLSDYPLKNNDVLYLKKKEKSHNIGAKIVRGAIKAGASIGTKSFDAKALEEKEKEKEKDKDKEQKDKGEVSHKLLSFLKTRPAKEELIKKNILTEEATTSLILDVEVVESVAHYLEKTGIIYHFFFFVFV
jgi:hypothetical protein